MAGRKFNGEPILGKGYGESGSSSLRIERMSAEELWGITATSTNAARTNRAYVYPVSSANQVQEPRRVHSPLFQSPALPLRGTHQGEGMRMESPLPLTCTTVRPSADFHRFIRPQGIRMEDLRKQLMPGSSSSSSSSRTSPLTFSTPSGLYFPQSTKPENTTLQLMPPSSWHTSQMSVGSEDECDLELRLSTRWINKGKSVAQEDRNPPFLFLGQEAEEGGHKNKKARTGSLDPGCAASGSSSGQEIDLELGL